MFDCMLRCIISHGGFKVSHFVWGSGGSGRGGWTEHMFTLFN